ncbi:helix-turn-helix domain-containing protein [Kitasatospora sp. NPDC056327]|uniref:helix-turn-helix domain-containing protein n=1 Tax=Kitasatospora sp. NPDC056327 TaxID=3345785 RepID=UPI0035DA6FC5
MPGRSNPTLRQRRLGAELRKMREQAGLGGTELGRLLGASPSVVTQTESAKIGVSAERVRSIAAVCKCTNQPLIDALAEMATERGKGWWEQYRGVLSTDFLEVAEMESHARQLSAWATTYVPGLLQTRAYATAVFARINPPIPQHDLDARTAFRLERQRAIGPGGAPCTAFIHEAALRMQFGGPKVLADQLLSLLEASEQPSIAVRAVPFDMHTFIGSGENLMFATGPVPELDTLQMDISRGVLFFDSQAELNSHRELFARMDETALPIDRSRSFIRSIKKELDDRHD